MKVRGENNSVMIKAIKYVLDELVEDVHRKKASLPPSLPVKNDTVTRWDTTYYTEGLHAASDTAESEEYNANEMGLIVMSEYVVLDERADTNASDFQTILKPLAVASATLGQPDDIVNPDDFSSDDPEDEFLEEPFLLTGD